MTGWRWDRPADPDELARYVQQDLIRKLLPAKLARRLPGPRSTAPAEKARLIYQVFADTGVRYVGEPTTSGDGLQTVRPVDQVLARPQHATCLDICVAYAGACLDAGLHPMIVVLDSRLGGPGHAIVLIWLDGSWSASEGNAPFQDVVQVTASETEDGFPLQEEIRARVDAGGSFLAIDVTGVTWPANTSAPAKNWAAAVADGAEMIAATAKISGRWRWGLGIDVGLARRTVPAVDLIDWRQPDFQPLTDPYIEPNPHAGPLTQIKARQGVVPFYTRDELDLLLEWAEASSSTPDGVELAVLHGVGGAGKTHLAAELCRRLDTAGWYTGFLAKHPVPSGDDLAWLAGVESPVLVVVDYVEDTGAAGILATVKALRGRESPTRVLLTARAIGDWLTTITGAAERDGLSAATPLLIPLPRRHPASAGVFRRAAQRFAELPGMVSTTIEQPPPNPRWTTLDLVLQAWLAAEGAAGDALPTQRDTLYDRVLLREFDYWQRTCNERGLPTYGSTLLARAGAVLTLIAPSTTARATKGLTAIEELALPTPDRALLIDVLTGLLTPDTADEGFAIRPDPVGERLVLREFTDTPALLDRCIPPDPSTDQRLAQSPDDPDAYADKRSAITEGFRACTVLTRAAEQNLQRALDLTQRLLHHHSYMWSAGLAVALNQGGPFAATLTELAEREDTPLPLAQLANAIPTGHAALRALALTATQRSQPEPDPTSTETDNLAALAAWSNNLAIRLGEVGDRARALAAIDEAVTHYRQLAENNPGAFLPNLTGSLNNQATLRGGVGDRAGALAAIDEAVTHYRQLAENNPGAFLPNLASSLNNQATLRGGVGDRAGALAAIDETVTHYRRLDENDKSVPGAFLPSLAMALNNQATLRSGVGDRAGALAAIDETVTHYRQLADNNPGNFLPDLASSLNNLAALRGEVGDRAGGLAAIDEAVTMRRQLADNNRGAFLPDLASSLNNQANLRSGVGDHAGALDAIDETVTHYRQLADNNPGNFLPDLATALNNQANLRSGVGDRAGGLAAIDEAVTMRRQLADNNPGAFLPDLATALNNQANLRSGVGDRAGGLAAIDEAVTMRRQLAETNPGAFLPHLADSLNNQANLRSGVGDHAGALDAIDETVTHYRQLAETNPGAFLPDLADSLNNQANLRSGVGDRAGGLAAIDEAVTMRRQLADNNPGAFLPHLASSLNNQANLRSGVGDRAGALAAIDEAVTMRRQLADNNPGAFLPDLAMALNNLAALRGEVGDRAGGLAAIDEAVTMRRQLAETNPGAFLPDLASSLNNQANLRSGVGDHAGALAAIDEAVTNYRQLAATNPGAFLPYLAVSSNNQANRRSEVGDRAGALAAIDEAVTHYRQLAETNPGAFLPDLADSLNNQASLRSEVGDRAGALAAFLAAWRGLSPGPQAELIARRALWRLQDLDVDSAAHPFDIDSVFDDLELAASTAAEPDLPVHSGAARQRIRDTVAEVVETRPDAATFMRARLPTWTYADLPGPLLDLLNQWLSSQNWETRESIIRDNATTLLTDDVKTGVVLARFLYPEVDGLTDLHDLLDEVRTGGLDTTLAIHRATHAHAAELQAWLTTSTWEGSRAILKKHPNLISDPRTLTLLKAASKHPVARQHLGILRLIQSAIGSIDDVYDAVIDPLIAADQAMRCLERLDTELLDELLRAAPNLLQAPFVGPYLLAARTAISAAASSADNKSDTDPRVAIEIAARTGTETQRAAGAARLRRIAQRESSVTRIFEDLAARLDPAATKNTGK
ncbi:hypothetical protein DMH03_28595 [Amycolatopsis sp. WAC 01376]|uniref:tetratricopeptide repeat protein n=1 Tax=Amycolatopsis sp. WAC 01376 TaxID=2203195 RepID=UPI000F771AC0|nr:tetratricopeptide repeat protein [Amycolatopsis sp. WAC 01376]RSM57204.1 hypothetical protein DMH03_28595 [Amycolatopsis sp. WAC 01376]